MITICENKPERKSEVKKADTKDGVKRVRKKPGRKSEVKENTDIEDEVERTRNKCVNFTEQEENSQPGSILTL